MVAIILLKKKNGSCYRRTEETICIGLSSQYGAAAGAAASFCSQQPGNGPATRQVLRESVRFTFPFQKY